MSETDYEKYFDPVFRYIVLCLGDVQEAEKITQDIFAGITDDHSFHEGTVISDVKVTIFKSAREKVKTYQKVRLFPSAADSGTASDGNGRKPSVQKTKVLDFMRVLEYLDEDSKDILLLKLCGGLSPEEMAQVTGQDADGIKMVQTGALRSLCEVLV